MRSQKGEQPEANLVRRAKSGDREAYASLYQVYLNAIYRYIYFRIDQVEDAQNLTEQVFINAWEALPVYQDRGQPFSSWLYTLARYKVLDYRRGKKGSQTENEVISAIQADNHNRTSVLKLIIQSQDTQSLAKAIARLPEDQQQVIILRFIEGLNQDEVSRLLMKNGAVCRKLQYRALSSLNQVMSHL